MSRQTNREGKVFVSYAEEDRVYVKRIVTAIRGAGYKVWVDYNNINPIGGPFPGQISEGLDRCNIFVLVWSKKASESSWVAREWAAALNDSKKIAICCLDKAELPTILNTQSRINFGDFSKGLNVLIRSLKTIQ